MSIFNRIVSALALILSLQFLVSTAPVLGPMATQAEETDSPSQSQFYLLSPSHFCVALLKGEKLKPSHSESSYKAGIVVLKKIVAGLAQQYQYALEEGDELRRSFNDSRKAFSQIETLPLGETIPYRRAWIESLELEEDYYTEVVYGRDLDEVSKQTRLDSFERLATLLHDLTQSKHTQAGLLSLEIPQDQIGPFFEQVQVLGAEIERQAQIADEENEEELFEEEDEQNYAQNDLSQAPLSRSRRLIYLGGMWVLQFPFTFGGTQLILKQFEAYNALTDLQELAVSTTAALALNTAWVLFQTLWEDQIRNMYVKTREGKSSSPIVETPSDPIDASTIQAPESQPADPASPFTVGIHLIQAIAKSSATLLPGQFIHIGVNTEDSELDLPEEVSLDYTGYLDLVLWKDTAGTLKLYLFHRPY